MNANEPNLGPHSLPRLDASCYRADAAVLWTLTTFDRAELPLSNSFHSSVRELILHTSVRERLLCASYVLMPDHIHFVWLGTNFESDQRIGMRFLRTHLRPLIEPARFQPQPHDHVFSRKERGRNAFARSCDYILLNPLRAELVKNPGAWPYSGALIPGYPRINPFYPDFWPTFWKIFAKQRDPKCDEHVVIRKVM